MLPSEYSLTRSIRWLSRLAIFLQEDIAWMKWLGLIIQHTIKITDPNSDLESVEVIITT